MTELHDNAVTRWHSVEPNPYERCNVASANETLVRRAIEAIWNRGDLDMADELFAPAFVNHNGLITDLVLGPEAIKISAAFYRLAFPDLHITIEALTTKEDFVMICWTAQRSSADDPDDRAFTASQTLLTGVTRSRLADGKIMESWTEWNRAQVFHDLGGAG